MAKRRKIRGKRLLIVSASLGAASFIACAEDHTPGPVANLMLPPDAGPADASFMDAPVANLLPPPDSGFDASTPDDAGEPEDADGDFLDAPVANLLPPPDGSF